VEALPLKRFAVSGEHCGIGFSLPVQRAPTMAEHMAEDKFAKQGFHCPFSEHPSHA
jgi:hypothetical protein